MSFNQSSLILDRSSQADLHSKSYKILDSNFTHKHTLSKSKTRLKRFDHGLPTLQNEVLIHQFLIPQNLTHQIIHYIALSLSFSLCWFNANFCGSYMIYMIMKQKHITTFILFPIGWMVFYMSNSNNMPCIEDCYFHVCFCYFPINWNFV